MGAGERPPRSHPFTSRQRFLLFQPALFPQIFFFLLEDRAPWQVEEVGYIRFLGHGPAPGNGIGLFIGGDAKNFKLTRGAVERVLDGILRAAEELDQDIFVTTSRRTPPDTASFLKRRLQGHPRCRLLIIANEKNAENTVSDILYKSRVVVVSPESMSMISEAVSSGKYTIVFRTEPLPKKYGIAIENFEQKGYITIAGPDRIYDAIKRLLTEKPAVKRPEDRDRIIQRLKGIV